MGGVKIEMMRWVLVAFLCAFLWCGAARAEDESQSKTTNYTIVSLEARSATFLDVVGVGKSNDAKIGFVEYFVAGKHAIGVELRYQEVLEGRGDKATAEMTKSRNSLQSVKSRLLLLDANQSPVVILSLVAPGNVVMFSKVWDAGDGMYQRDTRHEQMTAVSEVNFYQYLMGISSQLSERQSVGPAVCQEKR